MISTAAARLIVADMLPVQTRWDSQMLQMHPTIRAYCAWPSPVHMLTAHEQQVQPKFTQMAF
jgi:hypothetical protein